MEKKKKPDDIDFKCAIVLAPDFLPSSANWQTQKSSPPPSVKLSSQKLDVVGSVDLTPGKKHGLMLALVNISKKVFKSVNLKGRQKDRDEELRSKNEGNCRSAKGSSQIDREEE